MALIAPEVSPEPIRPPQIQPAASVETFGGGQGLERVNQQAQEVSRDAGDIGAFEKIKADQAAVEEAMGGKVSPYVTNALYDPQNGAIAKISRAQTTKEALQIHDDTNNDINNFLKKTAGGLSGGMQVGSFVKRSYPIADNVNKTLMAHVDTQTKKIYHDSFDSSVDNITTQAALGHGLLNTKNAQGITQQQQNLDSLQQRIDERAGYDGMTPDQKEDLESKTFSNYHAAIIDRKLQDAAATGNYKDANQYFKDNKKEITDLDIRKNVENDLVKIPKQQEELAKWQKQQTQDANLQTAMTNVFKGNLSTGEAQRLFMTQQIDKSGYDALHSIVNKPDYQISKFKTMDAPGDESDPTVFNQIRSDMLAHKSTPGEITRQMLDAHKDGKLSASDGAYLSNQLKPLPPNPHDEEVNAAANYVRSRLQTSEPTSILGHISGFFKKDKEGPNPDIESQVSQFYKQADSTKATGDDLKSIRDQIVETSIRKKYPGLPPGKLPDVMLTVSGKVVRLLGGDEKSEAKPRYKITPTPSQDVDEE